MKIKRSFIFACAVSSIFSLVGCKTTTPSVGSTIENSNDVGETSTSVEKEPEVYEEVALEHTAPYNITNNLGENAESELIVQWHNSVGTKDQRVQITTADDVDFTYARNVDASVRTLDVNDYPNDKIGDYDARDIFKATITGLEPGTDYIYRIGASDNWSDTYYHTTAEGNDTDFSFTVCSDPQAPTHTEMGATLRAANEYDPDHRFFICNGDIVNDMGYQPDEILSYTKAATEFNRYKPISVNQGNHDTYFAVGNNQYQFGEATIFNAFTTFPDNGFEAKEDFRKSNSYFYYYNNVLIVVMNTLIKDEDYNRQATWLEHVLAANQESGRGEYIIVNCHIGPIGNRYGDKWKEAPIRRTYTPIFSKYKVDCVFYGHDHTYARTNPIVIDGNTNLTTFDTTPDEDNGTVYSIVGATGPKFYGEDQITYQKNIWEVRTNSKDQVSPGVFVNVSVHDEELEVYAKRTDGKELDHYTVKRKDRSGI